MNKGKLLPYIRIGIEINFKSNDYEDLCKWGDFFVKRFAVQVKRLILHIKCILAYMFVNVYGFKGFNLNEK